MFKIAWRNIWRNKRRTLITTASIFFAIFFAIMLTSLQKGAWSNFLDSLVKNFSGHLQIQHKDYYKNPTVNYLMPYTKNLQKKLDSSDEVVSYTPMFQSGALASTGELSKVAIIMGVETNNKNETSNIEKNLITIYLSDEVVKELETKDVPKEIVEKIKNLTKKYYKNQDELLIYLKLEEKDLEKYIKIIVETSKFNSEYLSSNNNGVLIGFELAKHFELELGDSIIFLGQGRHGATAVGKYPVKGFLKFPSFEYNNRVVYMDIKNAQKLFSAYEINENSTDTTFLVNYVRINTNTPVSVDKYNIDRIEKVKQKVKTLIDDEELSVMDWSKINAEMTQIAYSKTGSSKIISAMLYLIIGFGIFGTVLMMIAERKRELGIMIAVGMKKTKLALIFALEMFFLGLLGIISGSLATIPLVLLGHYKPIRYTGTAAEMMSGFNVDPVLVLANVDLYYINQAFTVLFIIGIVIVFPLIKILKLNVIKSIRD